MIEKREEAATKSGGGQRKKLLHLSGWTGQGEEREDKDACMRQGQKRQGGNEILIHLSCRQI